ncbi:MAG TPA: hypothetical protein VEN79_04135 [Terriglobia bacterium]|nr:hypothetical protein [Terriglobia bacterium]
MMRIRACKTQTLKRISAAATESNEELVYEMLSWFDKYVKNAPPRPGIAAR